MLGQSHDYIYVLNVAFPSQMSRQEEGGGQLALPPEQISSGLIASRSSRMSEANSVCALNVSHSYQAVQSSAKHLLELTSTEELL